MQWIQSADDLERSRAVRFRPELRPILLGYFGLEPGMRVLEVCCGPGTLAPYLAAAVGHVTGLDLDPAFIARAQISAPANVDYVVGDAQDLPLPAGSFDAVLSYTGIGILAAPERAVAEMIRICRPGGAVGVAEAVTGPDGIRFPGSDALGGEPWPGARRYHERRPGAPPPDLGSRRWPVGAMAGLLAHLGLADLRLNAWGYVEAPDDARVPEAERHRLLRERDAAQQTARGPPGDLVAARSQWLAAHAAYDWVAGLSLVASGRKAAGKRLATTQ